MAKCNSFYTKEDKDNDKCYHNNDECAAGKNIKKENKEPGTGGRKLCGICEKMK